MPSVGRWTSLLVGSLLIASLPLVRPASARWGALFRAAARCAVTSAIMAAAAPPLFASIRSAVGLSPSPHAFALVLCGLAMGEELGPLGRLLHPPHAGSDVRSRSGALPVGSVADVTAAPGPGWKALGAVWVVFKMAAGWGGKMAARGGAVLFKMAAAAASRWGGGGRGGGGKMAAAGGTEKTGEGGRRTAGTGSGVAESGRSAAELRAGMTEWRRWRDGNGSGEPETGSGATATGSGLLSARGETFGTGSGLLRAPGESLGTGSGLPQTGSGAAGTGRGPSASTPHFLLFLLNAALLLLLQGALAAISAPGAGLGAGLGWAGHALTYGLWFRCPYSPGRPSVGLRAL